MTPLNASLLSLLVLLGVATGGLRPRPQSAWGDP